MKPLLILFIFISSIVSGQVKKGNIFYASYKDSSLIGSKDGYWIINNYFNKPKEEGRYLNGLKDSTWKSYNMKGEVLELGKYVKGKKEGIWTFTPYKDYFMQGLYINNKKVGDWNAFYNDTLVLQEKYDSLGLKQGKQKRFYQSGELNSFGEHKNGKLNGEMSGVASFSRTQKLRPILKTIRLELWQEQNDNLVKNLNRKQFG